MNLEQQKTENNAKRDSRLRYAGIVIVVVSTLIKILLNHNSPHTLVSRAIKLVDSGQYDQAIPYLNQAIDADSTNVSALSEMGLAYKGKDEYDIAINYFNRAINIDHNNAILLNNRAVVLGSMGKTNLALDGLNKAIQIRPNYTHAYRNRSLVYLEENKFYLALQDANTAIRLGPNDATNYAARNSIYSSLNQSDLAENDMAMAIKLNPKVEASLYMTQGIIYINQIKYISAKQNLDRVIQINPNFDRAFYLRGLVKMFLSNYLSASNDFKTAVRQKPDDPYATLWLHLARFKLDQEDLGEFHQNSSKLSLEKWPGPVLSLFAKDMTVENLFSKAASGDSFERNTQMCEANFYAGEFYLQQHSKDEAKQRFETAIQICPKDFNETHMALHEIELNP